MHDFSRLESAKHTGRSGQVLHDGTLRDLTNTLATNGWYYVPIHRFRFEAPRMNDPSRMFERLREGDITAHEELLSLVYAELKLLAAAKLRHERSENTLNTTALVHEAYLRLAPPGVQIAWNSRAHFFSAASEAMRRVLIDAARARKAAKRDGCREPLSADVTEEVVLKIDQILAIDEALGRLHGIKPDIAHLVKLRYFGGLSLQEAANVLDIAPRTAKYWWSYAKAWLQAELSDL